MASLGQAYVQIVPKAEGITGKIENLIAPGAKAGGEKGGKEGGESLIAGLKGALAKLAIGATIGAGIKTALDEGAKLQQSFGGIDTLYGNVTESAQAAGMSVKEYMELNGNAADKVKQFATEAAKAGISANDYAEQAVSFGAGLKQAFGGDAAKAAEAANTAILDMADNAAKMGTPLESIQNAYQGFAKGNYTMLDNLKLGYGGTKEEMQRLLADAEKLTGVKYDMNNLGDVYSAIHAIQGDLGLTGVAAKEASETFSGSFGAMQAAAANFAANLALGEDISGSMETLIGTIGTFVFGNLIPMLGNIATALPPAIATAIQTAAPEIMQKLPVLLNTIGTAITTYAPMLLAKGVELINNLINGIFQSVPMLVAKAQEMLTMFLNAITTYLPVVLENGKNIVLSVAQGILDNIPVIIAGAGQMIMQLISFLSANLPTIAAKGGEFLKSMATRIISAIPSVVSALAKLIPKIAAALIKLVPVALKAAVSMIKSLAQGIRNGFSNISPAIKGLIEKITKPLSDMVGKVKDIMGKVMNKLVDTWNNIKSKAQSVWEGIKNAITTPIEKAKELVTGAVDRIKSIFPISMGKIFSGVKLPHFKISGGTPPWGIGGQGTKPSVGIEWYKRGGIATNPTIYGIGEAGAEAIVPLSNPYMTPFAKAIAAQMPTGGNNTYNITVDGARDPVLVVDELLRQLNLKVRTA